MRRVYSPGVLAARLPSAVCRIATITGLLAFAGRTHASEVLKIDPTQKDRALTRLFQCAAGKNPKATDRVIAGPPIGAEWQLIMDAFLNEMSSCVYREDEKIIQVRLDTLKLRGMLAAAQLAAGRQATLPYTDYDAQIEANVKKRAAVLLESIVYTLGKCIAGHAPGASLAFVLALPRSEAERDAFNKLQPALDQCPLGVSDLDIPGARLREGLALVLYAGAATAAQLPADPATRQNH